VEVSRCYVVALGNGAPNKKTLAFFALKLVGVSDLVGFGGPTCKANSRPIRDCRTRALVVNVVHHSGDATLRRGVKGQISLTREIKCGTLVTDLCNSTQESPADWPDLLR